MREKIAIVVLNSNGIALAQELSQAHDITIFGHEKAFSHNKAIKIVTSLEELREHKVFILCANALLEPQGKVDFSPLLEALESIGSLLTKGSLLILESTVPVGFTENIAKRALEKASGLKEGVDFDLAYGAPFLLSHLQVKVGAGKTSEVQQKLAQLYESLPLKTHISSSLKGAETGNLINKSYDAFQTYFKEQGELFFTRLGESLQEANTICPFLTENVPSWSQREEQELAAHFLMESGKTSQGGSAFNIEINFRRGAQTAEALHKNFFSSLNPARILVIGQGLWDQGLNFIQHLKEYGHHVDIYDHTLEIKQMNVLINQTVFKDWEEVIQQDQLQQSVAVGEKYTLAPARTLYACLVCLAPYVLYQPIGALIHKVMEPNGLLIDLEGDWPQEILLEGMSYCKV